MNQLKEALIWIALGIPGMVLIGLVLHSLVRNRRSYYRFDDSRNVFNGILCSFMQVGARWRSAFRDGKGCNEIKF